jgi:hypothetical protein
MSCASHSINEAVSRSPGPVLSSELPTPGISPDGRHIAVAIPYVTYNYSDDNASYGGIYLIELRTHVVPEFTSGALFGFGVLLAGVALSDTAL